MKLLLASLFMFIPLTVQAEYLGALSANEVDPNSIANQYGAGNPYFSDCVTNHFGIHRSPYSNQSRSGKTIFSKEG